MISQPSIALAALLLLGLGACAQRSAPLSVTDRETVAACTAHAEAVYERLNKDAIYTTRDNSAPGSSTGLLGDPTAGLSDRYARDTMIDRCVRGVAPSGAPAVAAPSAAVPAR